VITRLAVRTDAATMTALLNEVIAIGGTTAHQEEMTVALLEEHYLTGADVLSAVVAEEAGRVAGWQSVGWWRGEAHIGTFVQPGLQARGAGRTMFGLTCALLREKGVAKIVASIRADNGPGLAYYARIGFVDQAHEPDFALKDGRVVGRVHRRFALV
jgi:L-amino acid N-acyltransferase YncA